MVFALGVLADAPDRVDAVEKRGELDRSSQRPVGALPTVELGQNGVHLFVSQYSHAFDGIPSSPMSNLIVVAGALIEHGALLVAQRARPPELAGLWELPGGKVTPPESDESALARELNEELGIDVTVGPRIGADVALSATTTLRAYVVTRTRGAVTAHDHRALRWVRADEIPSLPWVPADRAWLPDLVGLLAGNNLTQSGSGTDTDG
nr:NUDIX hydrolase [Mycolicibacterium gilvum PYR-GCK]